MRSRSLLAAIGLAAMTVLGSGTPALAQETKAQVSPPGYLSASMAMRQERYGEARIIYGRECEAGDMASCTGLAHLHRQGRGGDQDFEAAHELFDRACTGGEADACNNLAFLYFQGQGLAQNHEQARDYYRKACDLGDATGCGALGSMIYIGYGGLRDRTEGARLLSQACDRDDDWSCERLVDYGIRPDRYLSSTR